jgi:hypothetical protein
MLDMLTTKLLMLGVILGVLTMTSGCGVRVDDPDERREDGDQGRHELVAVVDGGYAADVTSSAFTCERSGDDQLDVALTVPDGPQAGLEIGLRALGPLGRGDAITGDNSTGERSFALTLRTPTGKVYRYDSLGGLGAGAHGALTVTEASDFTTGMRVWVDGLDPTLTAAGAKPSADAVDVRATVQCHEWR